MARLPAPSPFESEGIDALAGDGELLCDDVAADKDTPSSPGGGVNRWETIRKISDILMETHLRFAQELPNKAKTTKKAYLSALRTKLRQGANLTGTVSWEGAIAAFERSDNDSSSNWHLKRSALIAASEVWGFSSELKIRIYGVSRSEIVKDNDTQMARRAMGLDPVVRHTLVKWLTSQSGGGARKASSIASLLLRAGTLVGLRPKEWNTARLVTEDGLLWLRTRTLKQRVCDVKERRLGIFNFQPGDIALIERTIAEIQDPYIDWDKFYALVQRALSEGCSEIWGAGEDQRYNPYNARHQFCANNRAMQEDDASVAVLMGHESLENLTRYASPALSEIGNGKTWPEGVETIVSFPIAHPDDIEKVRGRRRRAPRKKKAETEISAKQTMSTPSM
jgi:hypothetical protein